MKMTKLVSTVTLLVSTLITLAQTPNVRVWGRKTFVPPDLTNAVAIANTAESSLALRGDGTVIVWDDILITTLDVSNVIAIAGGGNSYLALKADGTIFGYPDSINNITAIACGWQKLALKSDGSVIALNVGDTNVPASATNIIAISSGSLFSLALRNNGSLLSWDHRGKILLTPNISSVIKISCGTNHSMALCSNGTVVTWYSNPYSGAYAPTNIPIILTNVVDISAGGSHSLALKDNGVIVAWGLNYFGQTNIPADMPFVTAIGAGGWHSMALLDYSQPGNMIPNLLYQPKSLVTAIGSIASFRVGAIGSLPLNYQWYFETNLIVGENKSWLTIQNSQTQNSGQYFVVVSNNGGSATSNPAILSVLPSLNIQTIPMITIVGDIGKTYSLDYIRRMEPIGSWISLENITITNNPQYYFDVSSLGQPLRFYRLVQVP